MTRSYVLFQLGRALGTILQRQCSSSLGDQSIVSKVLFSSSHLLLWLRAMILSFTLHWMEAHLLPYMTRGADSPIFYYLSPLIAT